MLEGGGAVAAATKAAADALAAKIGRVLASLTGIVERYGGDVVKFAGDALICVFEDAGDTRYPSESVGDAVSLFGCALAPSVLPTFLTYSV